MSEEVLEINIANAIKHLSLDEIEELYQRYLDGEKNSVLIEDYKININPNKLIKVLPPKKLDDTLCPYCNVPMFTKRKSKSASSWNIPLIECFDCGHQVLSAERGYHRQQKCDCKNCVSIREQQKLDAEKEKRTVIRAIYDLSHRKPIDYSELNFFHKLILLTLFRMQTDEEFEYILSLDDPFRTEALSPTVQMDLECLKELLSCGAVVVDPESRIDAFVEDEGFKSFYVNKSRWIPNIAIDGTDRAGLNEVYNKIYKELKNGMQPQWENEALKILFRIAREEVLQYVYVRADELNIAFSAENKTREVVNQLLHDFSVSEIYYFVKKSVENAHIYYSKGFATNKKQAANTIPNKILSLGERAINEGWNTYKYNRDKRVPRSYISHVFYDFILQDEDAGFHKSPGKHWEEELHPRYFSESEIDQDNELCCSHCKSTHMAIQMVNNVLEVNCKDCGSIQQFTSSP
ncbi:MULTISPECIES: hypothetical protein [Aeromonas]|uniref:hypothetical protein n=1 Tax=Aeromonas TaxID=642 RepID=UPI001B6EAD3D|nr:hypothetical protein [Aeromonas veronii]MBP8173691.1 hypothetical protein [Aeromonadaceae bacterium]UWH28672.1 hypothetical protein KW556_02675 [Aeromonas veronii]